MNMPCKAMFISVSLIVSSIAVAEDRAARGQTLHPLYQQECAACHIAYPAQFLPKESWQRIMGNLNKHYGSDASVDAASNKTISAWLTDTAGSGKRNRQAPPNDRITQSNWFIKEHDEVSQTVWRSPAVKNPSNCIACHRQANLGDFNEHSVRIPK
jgi:mono/diheme cytochrome c family protein